MPHYLISGIAALVEDVRVALREEGSTAVGVDDIAKVPAACDEAGPNAFDGYIQLPATFTITGNDAVSRVHHYFADGVLARYHAVAAALPTMRHDSRLTFVMGVLPDEVSTDDDVKARAALVRMLGNAARADGPPDLRVLVLGSGATPREIALTALGRNPEWEELTVGMSHGSYADWRVELLGLMTAQM